MYPSGASRRFLVLVLLVAGLLSVSLLVSYRNGAQGDGQAASIVPSYGHGLDTALPGKAIAPKLGNATAKYVQANRPLYGLLLTYGMT